MCGVLLKIKKLIVALILVSFFLSDLPSELWRTLEIPETVDALLEPNYTEPTPALTGDRLSFYNKEYVSVTEEDKSAIRVSGATDRKYLLMQVKTENGEEILRESVKPKDGAFSKKLRIPAEDTKNAELIIYSNDEYYGEYEGWVMQYIYLTQNDGEWMLTSSPVYEHNKELFESAKSLTRALNPSRNIAFRDNNIQALASQITAGIDSDYDKALAIHDYICENFSYDTALQGTTQNYTARDALAENRAICSGFSNSYAALCRAAGLPCLLVSGYSSDTNTVSAPIWNEENIAGDTPNHAWNEVYADGRWIIVDTTWDCGNSWKDGQKTSERKLSHVYFDANLEFFSMNHKIISYRDI